MYDTELYRPNRLTFNNSVLSTTRVYTLSATLHLLYNPASQCLSSCQLILVSKEGGLS